MDLDIGLLAELMHGSDMNAWVHAGTGEIRVDSYDEQELDDDELDTGEWIGVPSVHSSEAYTDMSDFAYEVPDGRVRSRLLSTLEGRGVFRRFRDTVYREDESVSRAWNRFRNARHELRVLEWLRDDGLLTQAEHAAAVAERRTVLDDVAASLRQAECAELKQLERFERELWSPELTLNQDWLRLNELIDRDYEEISPSGIRTAPDALDTFPEGWPRAEVHDLTSRPVADGIVLVRWEARSGTSRTCRVTLWRRDEDGWRMASHQLTPLD